MNRFLLRLFIVFALILGIGFFLRSSILASSQTAKNHIPVCPGPDSQDSAHCHARVVVDNQGKPEATVNPAGYSPQQFLIGYGLGSGLAGTNQIIAIVDAYDHPNIKSDLDTYNAQFKLPVFPTCTTQGQTGCFQKVDQRGGTNYPRTDAGWALEISMDVEVAHAICQNCKILLVEADSNGYADLMAAVDRAVSMGATVISNSYGSNEFSGETAYDSHFNVLGKAITFSSGDSGYGAQYPASSPYVTAVGGTSLFLNSNNTYNKESAWNGAGSGCSAFETTKPTGQPTIAGCTNRIVADVSADADPNTGAAVYDSVRYQGRKGWFKVGGTSLSAPLIAATYALNGGVPAGSYGNALPYSMFNYSTNLHDVLGGSTTNCDGTALCTAVANYDGPTGLGTPNGSGAF